MIANWCKETVSGTPGTGTINLGGAFSSAYLALAAVFQNGQYVEYFAEDGNNKEHGIGLLTFGSPNTLARSQVLETLASGVYTRNGATAISLSSSAVISVGSSASDTLPNSWSDSPAKSSNGIMGINYSGISFTSSAAPTNNRLHLAQHVFNKPVVVSKLSINVGTAEASALAKCGIWQYVSEQSCGKVIWEPAAGGTLDLSTTGAKTHTVASPFVLQPGTYWIGAAVYTPGGLARLSCLSSVASGMTSGGLPFGGNLYSTIYAALAGGWTTALIGDAPVSGVTPAIVYGCPQVLLNLT